MTADAFNEAATSKLHKKAGETKPEAVSETQSAGVSLNGLRKMRQTSGDGARPAAEEQVAGHEGVEYNEVAPPILKLVGVERPIDNEENTANAFNNRAIHLLKTAGLYVDGLNKSHSKVLADRIAELYTSPKARLNRAEIIELYLDGKNEADIAGAVESKSKNTITAIVNSLFKTMKTTPVEVEKPVALASFKPEPVTVLEPETIVDETTTEESTVSPVPRIRTKGASEIPESKLEIAYSQLRKAVEFPTRVTDEDWLNYGQIAIVNNALQCGFSEQEATELWEYMQQAENGEFKKASPNVNAVMGELQPAAVRYIEQNKAPHNNPRFVIYESALVNFTEGQSLQATAEKLGRKIPARKKLTARSIVLEFAYLLSLVKKGTNV
ncbi:MAG: hypothetical protein WAR37_05045 [Candidatus Microsaccharimonas sp.]